MILRRLGNKKAVAGKILPLFPKHKIYIELFFGAGGMFFNKPRAKYSFLNDIDSEVYNCFDVLMRKRDELHAYIEMMPYGVDFWNECKRGEYGNEVERAVYFLVLSNFGYMGKPDNLKLGVDNSKTTLIGLIKKCYSELINGSNRFLNCDFRKVLKQISLREKDNEPADSFVYSDPPYLETTNNYNAPEWTKTDVVDCFNTTFNSGIKGAMSEFDHPFILEQAKERNLNVHIIGERQNMKNRRIELLITNYKLERTLF